MRRNRNGKRNLQDLRALYRLLPTGSPTVVWEYGEWYVSAYSESWKAITLTERPTERAALEACLGLEPTAGELQFH